MTKIPGSLRLCSLNVRVPERGSLGTRLMHYLLLGNFWMCTSTNWNTTLNVLVAESSKADRVLVNVVQRGDVAMWLRRHEVRT